MSQDGKVISNLCELKSYISKSRDEVLNKLMRIHYELSLKNKKGKIMNECEKMTNRQKNKNKMENYKKEIYDEIDYFFKLEKGLCENFTGKIRDKINKKNGDYKKETHDYIVDLKEFFDFQYENFTEKIKSKIENYKSEIFCDYENLNQTEEILYEESLYGEFEKKIISYINEKQEKGVCGSRGIQFFLIEKMWEMFEMEENEEIEEIRDENGRLIQCFFAEEMKW
jgi:hypothetical protein